ncbi:MAG: DNA double-strand break repair nuclease NurA [Sulfolobales archaeon]|nr:DNA double-strand break repair nuclease NurA [Sulfolobales archaeon]MDW8082965.1 DNA double-strand break repair nuclease NurA [Sulfolobales archaeon]
MPIHDSLVKTLSSAAVNLFSELEEVQDFLSKVRRDIGVLKLKTNAGRPPVVAAGDSSRILVNYSMAFVYAIQAVAVTVGFSGFEDRFFVEADAGYLIVSPKTKEVFSDEIISRSIGFLSRKLEVSTLLHASRDVELALFDGSLFYFLWYSKHPKIPRSLKSLKERPIKLRDIWRDIVKAINSLTKSGVTPIFVSKSIRRSYYLEKFLEVGKSDSTISPRSKINDILLINTLRWSGVLPSGMFLLEPVYIERVEDLPRPLDTLESEDRSLIEPLVPITVTYVVFNSVAQPYQITIPGKWGWEELNELVSSLYPYSHSGYPDPLRIAHKWCRIEEQEFKNMLLKLGVSIPTGRELLGEYI